MTADNAGVFALDSATGVITVNGENTLDYETTPSYSLTVAVSDGSLTATATVTINVTNVNEAPTITSSTFTIAEDAGDGATVGTLTGTATDADTTLTYSMTADNAGVFALDSATGVITVNGENTLDYETTPSYSLTVAVSDGSLTATATVTINVTNVNEAPTITGTTTFTIAEDATHSATVGTITGDDADKDTLTYLITAGNSGDAFAIGSATGAITVNGDNTLDHETTPSYSLTVTVSDGSLTATATVGINVTNVNEAPTITGTTTFTIAEDATNSATVGTLTGDDADKDTLTYLITVGNGGHAFALDSATGVITVNGENTLDYETTPSYSLTVAVSDGSLTATATVTINVTNVNEAPTITGTTTFTIAEDATHSATVGTLTGDDADKDTLTYSITAGNSGDAFAIGSATGVITVNGDHPLDYETTPFYSLTVSVSDGSLTATATVTINVTNVNEAPTITGTTTFTIAEDATHSATVGTLTGVDADKDTLTYSITAGHAGVFALDSTTGVITVNGENKLDYETTPSYSLTVAVSDGSLTATATVAITVTDINEAPTITSSTFTITEDATNSATVGTITGSTFTIAENADDGATVGTLTGDDADKDTLTYSITAGNAGNAFALDSATGVITVNGENKLDYETTPFYSLTVTVSDGSLTATATVGINVTNVNEAPTITGTTTFTIAEDATNSATVGTLTGDDADKDTLTYSITAGNSGDAFAIGSATGAITVSGENTLDYETTPSYSLTVSVSDGSLTATATVAITVTDINEAPTITGTTTFTIAEDATHSATVGTLTGDDADKDTLTYSITAGNSGDAFAIGSATGAITVSGDHPLDHETTPSYSLTVAVSDGGLTATATVGITVTDINEAPTITGTTTFTIAEDATHSATVGTLTGVDADKDTLTYSITAGNAGVFALDSTTGVITVNGENKLDYETTPSYSLTVAVSDGSLTATATVTINVTNVNEAPTITGTTTFTIAEDATHSATVGTLTGVDADKDTLTYSMTAGNAGVFALDSTTGVITVNGENKLDYETTPSYSLTVTVSDGSLTATATVAITVTDINEAPTITGTTTFTIAEDATHSATVGIITGVDADKDTLTYSMTVGNSGDAFALDSATGVITVNGENTLDYETTPSYSLTVAVSDGSLTATATVTINVTNVNEAPTITGTTTFTIAEDATHSATVGTLTGVDADKDTLTYSITAGHAGVFALDSTTGVITVNGENKLDYETTPSYSLTVAVSDGSLTATATVAITVTDINEAPTITSSTFTITEDATNSATVGTITGSTFTIAENADDGATVGTLTGDDADKDTLTYSITAGNAGNAFALDSATGVITVNGENKLDYETTPFYSLTVTVSDGSLTATATVGINVTNVNEAPTITGTTTFTIAEDATNSATVGTLTGDDADKDTLTYSITAGNSGDAFAIGSATGAITVSGENTLDYETTPSYSLTVSVSDGSLTATATVAITVTDINEAPTITGTTTFTIAEDATHSATVGTLTGDDADKDTLTYSITAGNSGDAFAIGSATGAITVSGDHPLDHETTPSYSLTVAVSDGGLTATATVGITVTDINEAPTITGTTTFTIAEDATHSATVGTLTGDDADKDTLTYSITTGNTNDAFALDSATGVITVNGDHPLDYETTPSYSLTVAVSDGSLTATATVAITVTDINEAPTITGTTTFTIAEDATHSATVGIITGVDADKDTLTYSITAGNAGVFALDSTTGVITVSGENTLDYETTPSYSLTVAVSDGSLTATATVTINVTNVNEAPTITSSTFTIAEDAGDGATVGTLTGTATDADTTLTYSMTADNAGVFALDSATGVITVNGENTLDYETTPSYSLTVAVSDGSLTATATVTINVTNVNEAPTITSSTFTIAEDAGDGATVGTLTGTATDADTTLTYSMTADNAGVFALDSATGVITVNGENTLDYETTPSYSLTVAVSDGSLTATATVTINVTNVNEAPTITGTTTFTIAEDATHSATVGTLTGVDADKDTLTYSITAGNAGVFALDSTTGVITVNGENKLDYETTPSYSLTVAVSDGSLTATATVAITVTDVNEAPTITETTTFTIAEDATHSATVGTLTGVDADKDTLTYSITAGNAGVFALDSTTGVITVNGENKLDYETTPSYSLTVAVSDGSLTATATVGITVTDINEAPTITGTTTFTIAEDATHSATVGIITGVDADKDTLTYSITVGNSGDAFALDSATGVITVNGENTLDYETTPSYSLTVAVSDGSLTATTTVTINVTNVNEAPTITGTTTFTIAEDTTHSATVGTLTGDDADKDTLTYSITAGNAGVFALDSTTGVITVNGENKLDYETTPSYSLTVAVSDGSLTATAMVGITVTDINEAPTITGTTTFTIAEDATNSATVGTLTGVDADKDTLTYSITTGNTNDAFALDSATGVITVNGDHQLDYETTPSYSLTVTVSDGSLTATATVGITVTDINEAPTITGTTTFTIAEDATNSATVGTITGDDADKDTLTYSITAGNAGHAFALDSTTGVITVNGENKLDYETTPSYSLTVAVSDGSLTATATVTINVTNVNEAPTITGTTTFTIAEDATHSATVGTLTGVDADKDTLTYSITAGNAGVFALDSTTGVITVNGENKLDYETTPSYSLTVAVSDGSLTATATVAITVTDINEAPTITGTTTFTIAEDATHSATVGIITGVDADKDTLTYSMTVGNSGDAFALDSATGVITVNGENTLDYETTPSYSLTVAVSDGSLTATATVTINVTNVNEAPTITGTTTFTIAEDATHSATVGIITGVDADKDTLTYSMTAGNAGVFALDSTTGVITVNGENKLDYETTPSYSLTVAVSDGSLTATATVAITVTDINEAPTITSSTFTITENATNSATVGTITGSTFTIAEDADDGATVGTLTGDDADKDTLTYSITAGNAGNAFALDSATGVITVNGENILDYETTPFYSLTVTVSDGSLTATATVGINVTNVNEAPTITGTTTFTIAEDATNSATVGTITGDDADKDTLTYSITAGNSGDAFAIGSATGAITVSGENTLDYETTPSYSLTVAVSDGSLTATATVTINVTNVNEAPTITGTTTFTIAEDATHSATVGTLTGVDADKDTLTYSITAGNSGDVFALDSTTGVITVNGENKLDYETTPSYSLTVTVSDGSLTATATVTINVTNVNEAPTITSSTFTIAEDAGDGATVGTLTGTATDADTTLTYSMTAGHAGVFALDSATGVITVNGENTLDYETTPSYSLTVAVSDGSLTATATVTINVTNVNEAPTITGTTTFTIAEDATHSATVGTLTGTATDADTTLTYSMTADNAGVFALDSATGVITVNGENTLDYETTPSYSLTVAVSDGSLTATATVTINVTNVNEAPTITGTTTFTIAEDATHSATVGTLTGTATDADTTLTYSMTADNAGVFALDSATGVITVNGENTLDYETTPSYSLTVAVSDGSLTATATVTINVTNVNEAPTITSSTFTIAEDAGDGATVGTLTGTATDADTTLTYSMTADNAGVFALDSATGVITVNGENTLDYETTPSYSLTVAVSDGSLTATATVTINVTNVNEAPTITGTTTFTIAEDATHSATVGTITGDDADKDTLTYLITAGNSGDAFAIGSATGAITVNGDNTLDHETTPFYSLTVTVSDGSLTATATVGINVTNVNEAPTITGTTTFTIAEDATNSATVGTLTGDDADKDTLTYLITVGNGGHAFALDSATGVITVNGENTLDYETTPSYSLTVAVSDGSLTATATVTINVTNVNEAPTITGTTTFTIAEDATHSATVGTLTGDDADKDTLTYSITAGNSGDAFAIGSATGVITVNGDHPLDYETTPFYSLTVSVSDGSLTATATVAITVTDVTESATLTITYSGDSTVAENQPYTSATPTITDTPIGTVTWALAGADTATFTIDTTTGVVSMIARDYEAPVDADRDNIYSATVTATDSDSNEASVNIAITVTDVTESATFTIADLVNAEIQENTPYTGTPSITGTPVGTVTWALAGADTATFTIDTTTGVVSMVARDYEAPVDANRDNIYSATVTATDNDSNRATQDIAITVTDVTESATFTIAGLVNAEIQENTPYTGTPSITGTPVGTVTWALAGADTATFAIDTTTGVVSMIARDYEAPVDADRDNIYSATVTATDSDSNRATQDIAITVTDVTESATFTIAGLVNAEIQENTPYTGTPSITGTPVGTVTWALAGADTATFTIDTTTGVVSMIARDYEAPVDADRNNIYSATVTATDSDSNEASVNIAITVTDVTETATLTIAGLVNAEIQENTPYTGTPSITGTPVGTVTWALAGADTATFTIDTTTGVVSMIARDYEAPVDANRDNIYSATVTATDSDSNRATQDIAITVTDVTESATFTIAGLVNAEIQENTPYTGTPSITGTPVGTVTWALAGADTATFTIDTTTGVVSMIARDYEAPVDADRNNIYSATVTATDSDSNHATQDIAITVTDVTESATFTIAGLVDADIQENTPYTGTPTITGTPVGTVTWALAGADTATFTIDTTTGVVSMVARDYEAPVDADRDNVYSATVTATDSDSNEASVNIAITVTDVTETATLTIAGLVNAEIQENTPYTGTPTITGTPVGTVTWALAGADTATFTIDTTTGVVSMVARDYEAPVDANRDNIYSATVTVTDRDSNHATQDIAITVTDVNEAPTIAGTPPATIAEDTAYRFIPEGGDKDANDMPVYSLSNNPAWLSVDADMGELSGTPANADVGEHTDIVLTVTSGGETATLTFSIEVTNTNDAGTLTISGTVGEGDTLIASVADADGIEGVVIAYQWQAGTVVIADATSNTYTLTRAEVGKTITVTASYTDQHGTTETLTVTTDVIIYAGGTVPDNSMPSGLPQIFGTPTQGAELVAVIGGIKDADGADGPFTYQWLGAGSAISGATDTFLVLTQAQVGQTITVTVSYTDGGNHPETLTSAPTVAVTNTNDAPMGSPTITGTPTQGQTLTAGTDDIRDADGLGSFSYQWEGDGNAISGATSTTFVLTQAQVGQTITVKVSYTDGGDTRETLTSAPTNAVTNTNDAPTGSPTITSSTFTIAENADDGATVGTITGTATETGTTLTYSITVGNAGNAFALDSATGVITVSGDHPLDHETTPSYSLTVAVSDGSLTATATVTINVTNVNEVPTITSRTFTIAENAGDGATVGTITGTATDADTTLTYSMTAGNAGVFALDSATGVITVNGENPLDYETTPSYSLTVAVSDGSLTATATVTINVTNVNEVPTITSRTFTIAENAGDGATVGTITGTATDADTTLTYSMTAGNTNDAFALDSTTGVITVSGDHPLDYETTPSYSLTVAVSDGSLTATAIVSIIVTNANEAPIAHAGSAQTVDEEVVVTLDGSGSFDPDGDTMTYAWMQTQGMSMSMTGVDTVMPRFTAPSGLLTDAVLIFSLTVNDGSTDSLADTVSIAVNAITNKERIKNKQLNEAIMPRFAQTIIASSAVSVEYRVDTEFSNALRTTSYQLDGSSVQLDGESALDSMQNTVEQKLPTYIKALKDETLDWKRMLGNSSFMMSLDSGDGTGSGATVWGSGAYTSLDGKSDNPSVLDWHGDVFSIQLGVDKRVHDDLLVGGLMSWSEGDVDYTLAGERGKYTHQVISVHPYLAWSRGDVKLWGSAGYGRGNLAIEENDVISTTDTDLLSLLVGVKKPLSPASGVSVKSDIALVHTRINESVRIAEQDISSQRLRLLLVVEREYHWDSGGVFKPVAGIGLRYDGGAGDTGAGVELNMTMHYDNPITGLAVRSQARALLGRDDYKDWGVQGVISLDSGADERGLSFKLSPSYGNTDSRMGEIWRQGLLDKDSDDSGGNQDDGARMDAYLGYGLSAPNGRGLLLPYGEMTVGDSRSYRLGLHWKPSMWFDMNIVGERSEGKGTASRSYWLGLHWKRSTWFDVNIVGERREGNGTANHKILLESRIRL